MEKLYLICAVDRSWRADLLKDFKNKITLNTVYSALDCFFSATMSKDIARELAKDVRVKHIEEEKDFTLDETRGVPSVTGNWGLDRIDQRFLPLDSTYTFSRTGAGVDIYIQDTGIRSTHNEYVGRVEPLFKAGFATFEDEHGHGSHVAGIAAGKTYGVAPGAKLLIVRSFSASGTATNTALLDGFEAILEHHQAKNGSRPSVVNMSFSGRASALINNAVKVLIDGGSFSPFSVFNNGVGDWRANILPAIIGYQFASPSPVITRYNIESFDNDMAPKSWVFQGSNDGVNYTILDTQINQTVWSSKQNYFIGNTTPYEFYRLKISQNNGNPTFTRITQLEFKNNPSGPDLVPKMTDFTLPSGVVFADPDNLTYSGIVVCVAAGNSSDKASNFSPASLPEAITVAASGIADNFAVFSNASTDVFILSGLDATNFGSSVDIIAPGVSIRSSFNRSDTDTLSLSGTSMSSPHVAGVCALFLEANPNSTPAEVQQFIIDNATPNRISLSTEAKLEGTPNLLLYSNFAEPAFVLDWVTTNGNLDFVSEGVIFEFQLVAESVDNLGNSRSVSYQLINGALPPGLSMSGGGLISGTVSENVTNNSELFVFTIQVTDRISTVDRIFNIVIINTNRAPIWQTPNVNPIGSFFEGEIIGFQLEAVDPDIEIVIYTLDAGSLPPGLFVNTSGFISGTIGQVVSTTTFAFTMKASDPFGNSADRAFAMIVETFSLPLVWRTEPGSLGEIIENDAFEFQLAAGSRAPNGDDRTITFSIVSGGLPSSLAMGVDGLIQGFADDITLVGTTKETSSFTVNIGDGIDSINRTFTITVVDLNEIPEWSTPAGVIGSFLEGDIISIPLTASDPDAGDIVTFSLHNGNFPPDIIISSGGVISGTIGTITETTTFEFTIRITDTKNFVDRTFSIFVDNLNKPPVFVTDLPIEFDGFDFIGVFREGDFIDFQFEGFDPEGDPLEFSIGNGSIPDDLILEPGGRLVGSISSIFTSIIEDIVNVVPDPTTAGFFNNKRFRFDVALTDGENTVTKGFQITVTDVPKGPLPVWISPEDLGTFIEGEPIFIPLSATAFLVPAEDIFFTEVAGLGLPTGLTLSVNGEIFGSIPDVTVDTTFNIRLEANVFVRTVSNFDPNDAEASFLSAGITEDPALIIYVFDDIIDTFYIFNGIFVEVFITNLTSFDPNDSAASFTAGGIPDPSGISFVFDTTDTIYYHLDDGVWVEIINTALTNFDVNEPELSFIAGGILSGFETINFVLETSSGDFFFVSNEFEVLEIIEFKTAKDFFFRVLNRENLDVPVWITSEGLLGSIDVYDDSLFVLEGTTDTGLALTFDLISGELPPGLRLDGSGIIIGTIASHSITTELYEFIVEIKTAFNTSLPRTFQIDVNRYFNDPDATGSVVNVCIPITGDIKERLNEHELIPLEFLFRPTDPNFGRVPLKEIFIANGVNFTSLVDFFNGLQSPNAADPKHHDQDWDDPANTGLWFTPNLDFMRPTVFIGKYNWAPFRDSEDNIIYEVVYREIIDPQERAYFPGRLNPNPLNNPLEPEFEPAVEYKQFSVVGNPFNNNDLNSIPEAEFLEPQSLKNLRREILQEFGISDILDPTGENVLDGIEKIPQWIKNSENVDVDGFDALIPLAYVLPGRGNDSVSLLNSFDRLSIPLEIIIDRWLVKVQSETIWEEQQTIFDDENPTNTVTDPDHRTLHNTTRVDLKDNRGHYIKFKKDPL